MPYGIKCLWWTPFHRRLTHARNDCPVGHFISLSRVTGASAGAPFSATARSNQLLKGSLFVPPRPWWQHGQLLYFGVSPLSFSPDSPKTLGIKSCWHCGRTCPCGKSAKVTKKDFCWLVAWWFSSPSFQEWFQFPAGGWIPTTVLILWYVATTNGILDSG